MIREFPTNGYSKHVVQSLGPGLTQMGYVWFPLAIYHEHMNSFQRNFCLSFLEALTLLYAYL